MISLNNGHVLVKLLISLISVSVISTAILNVHLNAGQQIYYEDLSSLMSVKARCAFDRLSYHLRLAGYANTGTDTPVEVIKGELSDSLNIRHNDVEILFYIDYSRDKAKLIESVDGSLREVADGITSLRFEKLNSGLLTMELTLSNEPGHSADGIVTRSFSTSVRLGNF